MYKRLLVSAIVALALSLGTMRARGAESEKPVSLNKVPVKVRATIKKHAEGAKIGTVEIVTTKVYEVEIRKNGKTTEFSVSIDGKYLGAKTDEAEAKHAKKSEAKEEEDEDDEKGEAKEKKSDAKQAKKSEAKEGKEEDEDDEKGEAKEKKTDAKQAKKSEAKEEEDEKDDEKAEAKEKKSDAKKGEAKEEDDEKDEGKPAAKPSDKIPGPVQATAKKLIGKGKMLDLARESDGTYELDYQVKGVHQAAIITVAGKIEEREITVPASTLPKAVINAVKKRYPKGKINVAEKSTTKDGTVFELEVTETHGVDVTPEGKVK